VARSRLTGVYFAAGIILPFVRALVLTMVLGPAMRLMNRQTQYKAIGLDTSKAVLVKSATWVISSVLQRVGPPTNVGGSRNSLRLQRA
jgi:predicted PurR-regulated permease PerM